MKKPLLMTVFCLFAGIYASQAQLQKGNVLVGGDITNLNLQLNNPNTFRATIDPKAAWFIQDNLAIGPYVDISILTAKGSGTDFNYGFGLFGRYYVHKVNDQSINIAREARFFLEANVGVQGNNPAHGGNTNGLGLGFGPGLAYFITSNVALEALLKFNPVIGFGSNTTNSYLNLGVGFQIYLPNKRVKAALKGQ